MATPNSAEPRLANPPRPVHTHGMALRFVQVDAFTDRAFAGNPAAVVVLPAPAPAAWMQDCAAEMNLSETAFLFRRGDAAFDLRWFTPAVEVDLCGHATLASAHALWTEGHEPARPLTFHTRSGPLGACRNGAFIELDFPALATTPAEPPPGLVDALGASPRAVLRSRHDVLVEVDSPEIVAALQPDFTALRAVGTRGVIVTAAGGADADFVSRFFAPGAGIDEDPVTGSAHCALAPFWGARLGRTSMTGRQLSKRGGTVHVTLAGERVTLGGQAVTVLRGEILPPPPPTSG